MFLDLTPEQEGIIGIAKQLAAEFAERAEQHDREGSFPVENITRLKETGYTTMTTPREFGGWEASPLTFVLAQEQLVQGCAATAFAINMHCNSVGFYTPFMTPAQKELYLGNVGRKKNAFERILYRGWWRTLDHVAGLDRSHGIGWVCPQRQEGLCHAGTRGRLFWGECLADRLYRLGFRGLCFSPATRHTGLGR